jgi:hypothetical protein
MRNFDQIGCTGRRPGIGSNAVRLGAAVVMQWNTIPTKLQRELFNSAASAGKLLQTSELSGQIAGILHKHEDG